MFQPSRVSHLVCTLYYHGAQTTQTVCVIHCLWKVEQKVIFMQRIDPQLV